MSGPSRELKREIWQRDRWRCAYCRCRCRTDVEADAPDRATVDHVRPVRHGGSHRAENLVTACFACNQEKGCYWPGIPPRPRPATLAEAFPDWLKEAFFGVELQRDDPGAPPP